MPCKIFKDKNDKNGMEMGKNTIIDAPAIEDLNNDNIYYQLMSLEGTKTINGVVVCAIFDENIDGDDYYKYIINGTCMMFKDAYEKLIKMHHVKIL